MLGAGRLAAFADGVNEYCDRYLEHMRAEEEHILPLAPRCWSMRIGPPSTRRSKRIEDPLMDYEPEPEFEADFAASCNCCHHRSGWVRHAA